MGLISVMVTFEISCVTRAVCTAHPHDTWIVGGNYEPLRIVILHAMKRLVSAFIPEWQRD
jgi:hypothetical protein